jgi:hypothetical protein
MSLVKPIKRRVLIAVVTCLTVFTVASTSASAAKSSPKHKVTAKSSQPLPPIVNGVPVLDLAKHALGAAEAYGVSKPFNVRAVVTTQAALYAQVPAAGGAVEPEYVVTLRGRFSCGYCGTATPPSTTTTDPSTVRISTMVLQLPIPLPSGATTGIAVGVGTPDLAKLGHIYDLDPYIKSLAGVSVPKGPLPG